MRPQQTEPNLGDQSRLSQGLMKTRANQFEFLGQHRNKENISQDEMERIRATKEMIPQDVRSILDVGCGDGRIIENLNSTYKAVGMDYAFSSIARIKTRGIQ